jgi:hypothetical protein
VGSTVCPGVANANVDVASEQLNNNSNPRKEYADLGNSAVKKVGDTLSQ